MKFLGPCVFLCAVLSALPLAARAGETGTLARWVQYTAAGAEARIVTTEACPSLSIDGKSAVMAERAAPDRRGSGNFPVRICATGLPVGAKRLAVGGAVLPAPNPMPQRIVVVGDTGCRIKGGSVQACDDAAAWPWARIAARAAAMRPDLVIHVGDYLYRESPCPAGARRCAGSPWGDNWATWEADFFAPAQALLAAAPWVFVRGNHEECRRAGHGWTRLLGPVAFDAAHPCAENQAPYAVTLDGLDLVVVDDANAPELPPDPRLIPVYRADFQRVAGLAARNPTWLLMHRPIRGLIRIAFGFVVGGNLTLLPAVSAGLPPNVELMLSGHIHVFEALNYDSGSPPQFIVGNGGDKLESAPADLDGMEVGGLRVSNGLSLPGFGFLVLTRDGGAWRAEAYDVNGVLERRCSFAERLIRCERG